MTTGVCTAAVFLSEEPRASSPWATAGAWWSALKLLALRELRIRYKSPMLGVVWALAVPLAIGVVLALVFGRLIPIEQQGVPYFLFLIVALFPWNCMQTTITASTTSVQDNGMLVRTMRFPRQLLPCALVLANFINFLFALVVVCALTLIWSSSWHGQVWLLPVAVIFQLFFTLGAALLVSALQVQFRDTKYLVEVALLMGFYLTPIIYPAATLLQLGGWARWALLLNPVAGVITLYRAALFGWGAAGMGEGSQALTVLGWAGGTSAAMLLVGWRVFRSQASMMADWVQR